MRKKLFEKVKNNKKLYFIGKCIRNINSDSFIDEVLDLRDSPFTIKIDSFGTLHKDKVLYFIKSGDSVSGFFSEYRRWLESLFFAERLGLIPIISLSKNFFYAENEVIFGTDNPFEYYFKQPSNITVIEALNSYNVVLFCDKHRKASNDGINQWGYDVPDHYISDMARINKKYIHLNDRVENELRQQIYGKLQNRKTIGVHIRGTDFKVGYDNHPMIISPQQFLENTEEFLTNSDFEQVFLATDEFEVVELFRNKFQDKLVYYDDVQRGDGEISVVFSNTNREHHKYRLGFEVLRDMHTLAACNALIAGISSVSTCARIEKRSNYDVDYEYLRILNNGINSSPKTAEKDIKKLQDNLIK